MLCYLYKCRKNPFFLIRPGLVEEIGQELLGRQIQVNNTYTKSDRPTKILVRLNQVRQALQLKTIFATNGREESSPFYLNSSKMTPTYIYFVTVLFIEDGLDL